MVAFGLGEIRKTVGRDHGVESFSRWMAVLAYAVPFESVHAPKHFFKFANCFHRLCIGFSMPNLSVDRIFVSHF